MTRSNINIFNCYNNETFRSITIEWINLFEFYIEYDKIYKNYNYIKKG